ncbi:MAG: DUF1189 family protein [Candidatus Peregrinibacteria bacterium]|nr:DUF1189 family protein [Candidatus Peregrinibacteria bacterium]
MSTEKKVGFFAAMPKSVYSPEFYSMIPGRSFWKAFWYFVGVTFLISILFILTFTAPLLSNKAAITDGVDKILEIYPEELVFTIEDGKASVNVAEPYIITLPEFTEETGSVENFPVNLVVIDTQTPFSVEQMREYETLLWITSDSLISMDGQDSVTVNTLSEFPNVTIDKELVDTSLLAGWDAIKRMLPVILIFMAVVMMVVFVVGRLFYVLILSVLILILTQIMGIEDLSFGGTYKIGLHAITLAMLVDVVVMGTTRWTGFNGFSFMFTVITLIVVGVNLKKAQTAKLIK